MTFDPNFIVQLEAALKKKLVSFELFGEEQIEGIRACQACFCPNTGTKLPERKYAIALQELAEAKVAFDAQMTLLKKADKALDDLIKHIAKAERKGAGVENLSEKEFLEVMAVLVELEEKNTASR